MVKFHFQSLQMDLRYWIRQRVHMLGIWVNVEVYRLVWINAKSSIEHLFFLVALKANLLFGVHSDVQVRQQHQLHLYIHTLHPESCLKAFEPIFTKELVFDLYIKHAFHGIKLCQIQTARWTKRNGSIKPFHITFHLSNSICR
jgi:hypothetical protein